MAGRKAGTWLKMRASVSVKLYTVKPFWRIEKGKISMLYLAPHELQPKPQLHVTYMTISGVYAI